jgi:dynein heavy chain
MVVPDLQKIAENMLFSEGFDDSKSLAKKVVVLYKLSKGQLSKQYHYNFGLWSMKTVLVMAGDLKRQYSKIPEELVLMHILQDANMPKVSKIPDGFFCKIMLIATQSINCLCFFIIFTIVHL